MKVEYKAVEGFSGYKVGDDGSVWSCRKQISRKGVAGFVTISCKWRKIKQTIFHPYNYLYVMFTEGPIRKKFRVNVLVLTVFIGKAPKGHHSRHLNGNSFDNRLSNLAWGTASDNAQDSIKMGTFRGGPNSKRKGRIIYHARHPAPQLRTLA